MAFFEYSTQHNNYQNKKSYSKHTSSLRSMKNQSIINKI